MVLGVLLPALGLVALAILVPRGLEVLMPETPVGLLLNGALSSVVLTLAAAGYFLWAYGRQGAVVELFGEAPAAAGWYFLRLGLTAGLIWAPVMVLTVSTSVRRWKEGEW